MLKDTTYKDKFAMLQSWMPQIIDSIKRDLRNEHLRNDIVFAKHYFPGKNPAKLTSEELAPAYIHVMANGEKTEELGEFIANRWLLKHSDLYHFFEQELTKLNPNFNELTSIDKPHATKIMEESVKQFGAMETYLFCVFNSVVFPEEIYKTLSQKATSHAKTKEVEEGKKQGEASIEALKRNYELQIARLTDKYEKKLLGFQKKYTVDVETLKKQVVSLQRKLTIP